MADLDAFPWSSRRRYDAFYFTFLGRIYGFSRMGIIDIRASMPSAMLVKKSQTRLFDESDMCQ